MTYESVFAILSDFILENLDPRIVPVEPGHRLQEDLGLESLGLLSLSVKIENHFQIYLDESPAEPPETIDDVVRLILQRLDEQKDAS